MRICIVLVGRPEFEDLEAAEKRDADVAKASEILS